MIVNRLADISSQALGELRSWFEMNYRVSYKSLTGKPPILASLAGHWEVSNGGRDTCHFAGAAVSDTKTVAHGLGTTPALVLLNPEDDKLLHAVIVTGGTNFTCRFRDVTGTRSDDPVFNWFALA